MTLFTTHLGRSIPQAAIRRYTSSTARRLPRLAVERLEDRAQPATLQFGSPNFTAYETGGTAIITVTRTGGSTGSSTVNYATSNGTAAAASDYVATSGTLSFADGQTSATFTVSVLDDALAEGNQTVNLTISNPTGGSTLGSPTTAVLTILDNESPAPTAGAHALALTHWPGGPVGTLSTDPIDTDTSGSTVLAWVGRADKNTFTPANVPTDNYGNTAIQLGSTHDYSPQYASAGFALYSFPSFNGGSGNVFHTPMPVSDEVTYLVVEVKNGDMIQDFKYNRVEAAPYTTLSVTTTGPATLISFWTGIDGSVGGVNAVPNNGFTVLKSQSVSYDAIQASVAAKDVSAAGTYDVTWTVSPAQTALMYLVAIQHSAVPQPGAFQFSTSGYSVNEGQGTATITVSRTGGSSGAVAVNFATADGTATAGSDYTATSGTLNFADGQTSATFTVPILEDTLIEGNQTINLTLSNPTGGAVLGAPATAMLSITDNDAPAVQSVVVNGGGAQRSMVNSMEVTFNTAVVLGAKAFTLTRVALPNGVPGDNATIGTIGVSTQVVNGLTVATLTFGGANTDFGSLQDGDWLLTVDRTKVQAVNGGAPMAADYNQPAARRLFGDVDGDHDVDATDFGAFRLAFGSIPNAAFDLDGDGDVDATDFGQFRQRFGQSV